MYYNLSDVEGGAVVVALVQDLAELAVAAIVVSFNVSGDHDAVRRAGTLAFVTNIANKLMAPKSWSVPTPLALSVCTVQRALCAS